MSDPPQSFMSNGDLRQNPLLAITDGNGQIRRQELLSAAFIIGRLPECDIQLDSARVSRHHAELARDDADRWILRDLASRNGTRVNGQTIGEQRIGPDDLIQIGEFELRLTSTMPDPSDPPPDGQTTLWAVEDPDASAFRTLASSPAPRLNAAHLAKVSALSQRLVEIPDPRLRMIDLCRTLVGSEMSCNSAVVLRVKRTALPQPPQLLCPFQLCDEASAAPGISRAVVEATIRGEHPILAGGAVSSGLTASFSEAERGVTAIIGCPLRADASADDVLYATVPYHYGTVDWLALVALAAEQFKKAELQIEARHTTEANAALQHDLKKARKIQMSLVPNHPAAPGLEIAIGFEPCLWVGGDYVNVLPTPDSRVLLTVADASGKGLPAAMVATGVHSIIHASVSSGVALADLADRLNRFLLESMDRQSFVTMLAMSFDPASGSADCINAGHPPMLIVDVVGTVREMPYGHNPPLGVVPMTIEIDSTDLKPGELLLMFTDGVTEMLDADGKMIGLEGIESRVASLYAADPGAPLSDLSRRLDELLDSIRGSRPATDDRTFLLARRQTITGS